MAGRRVQESLRHERLGVHHRRCRARSRVRAARQPDLRFLRRRSSRQQPLRQLARRAGCNHRQGDVVPAAGAPRSVGLRSGGASRADRGAPRRAGHPGRRPDHEDGDALHVQPGHRRAAVRHGRAPGAADSRPRGVHRENAAVHDQAAAAGAVEIRSREGLLHADPRARRLLQGRLGEARDVRRRAVRADAAERQRRHVPQHARRRRLRRRRTTRSSAWSSSTCRTSAWSGAWSSGRIPTPAKPPT